MRRIILTLAIVALPLISSAQTFQIFDHFDGSELSDIWQRVGGDSSNFTFDNSIISVDRVSSGIQHPGGPWYKIELRTPLDAASDFLVTLNLEFDRTANGAQMFEFVLADSLGVDVIGTRLWNSPSQVNIAWADGDHEVGPLDCWVAFTNPLNPTNISFNRSDDSLWVKYDSVTVLACATDRAIADLRFEFMVLGDSPQPHGFSADSLFAIAECCEVPGDANRDGVFGLADVLFTIKYVFASGPAAVCLQEADSDGNGVVNLADIRFSLKSLFRSGDSPICAPIGQ